LFIEDAIEGIAGIMIEFLASLPEGGTSAENDDPGDKNLGPLPGEKVVHGEGGKDENDGEGTEPGKG
jgi:hypothetical protein